MPSKERPPNFASATEPFASSAQALKTVNVPSKSFHHSEVERNE
jgi:hypothetical protein